MSLAAAAPPSALPVEAGNALTLPAHRHLVRVERGNGRGAVLLLAVQRGGSGGRGLGMYRSEDGGRSWKYEGPIQEDAKQDRADVVAVGRDVALVYSVETPDGQGISGSPSRDVYFQWWRYQASSDRWAPGRALKVFDSRSSRTAYYRAELARDSRGRLWVQAFRREPDGKSTLVISVSTDGGSTFREQPALDRGISKRGGGRLLHLGGKLVMVYGSHSGGMAARFRVRDDGAPLSSWSPVRTAFPEGIYHGAALSAVADGRGGMHLVYKDNSERLMYRRFDGRRFGSARVVHERGDWALQPAITRVGSTVHIFYNRPHRDGRGYDLVVRRLSGGSLGSVRELASISGFAGYPAAVGVMPSGARVPCLFGLEPRHGSDRLVVVFAPSSNKANAAGGEKVAAAEDTDATDESPLAVVLDGPESAVRNVVAALESAPEEASAGCGGGQALAALLSVPLLALGRHRRKQAARR
ncbi:hypothetical protein HG543_51950 [Pyxidicoccus fallax]|uniref:Exo-alpha-sialidase n=1 Tax=Pyxidicoccus fallax TaxID=394095 RepID=A0A848M1E9_9BACT|nr:hypothetical protein [Pyxidicoccus fallax]